MRANITQSTPTAHADIRLTVDGDTYASVTIGEQAAQLLYAYEDEQIWGGVYHFLIDNSDEALNAVDYEGKPAVVNHSFVGETGSDIGDLWVDKQEFISKDGKLQLHLTCIDAWGLLSRVKGTLGGTYWNYPDQTEAHLAKLGLPVSGESLPDDLITAISSHSDKTVQEIITTTILDALGMTVDLDDDDSLTTVQKPQVSAIDARSIVVQALAVTKSYLLWKADGKFHVIQPDGHASIFTYNTAATFWDDSDAEAVTIPNRVYYWFIDKSVDPADPDTWLWGEGHAIDTTSYDRLGIYIDEHHNMETELWEAIADQATADARAAARLLKLQLSKATGTLVAPMHCSQELFDAITITDDRYDTPKSITGYVFRIIREFDRGVYRITLTLGGVETGYTPPGGEVYNVTNTPRIAPIPPPAVWQIPAAIQGYFHDIVFSSTDQDTVAWTSGTITFYDGSTQAIAAGNTGNMADTDARYVYFDLDDGSPNVLKIAIVATFISGLTTKKGVVCLVKKAGTGSDKASFLPSYGKEPLINTDYIYMAGLLLHDFGSSRYLQSILATQISAGKIYLSSETSFDADYDPTDKFDLLGDTLDEVPDGSTYQRVRTTQINAGNIELTSTSFLVNEDGVVLGTVNGTATRLQAEGLVGGSLAGTSITGATNPGGGEVTITTAAAHGLATGNQVLITGTDSYNGIFTVTVLNATTFKITDTYVASETGYAFKVQVFIQSSDGKLYAGGGAVILDASGLTVKGSVVVVQDTGGVPRGTIGGTDAVSPPTFVIFSPPGTDISLWAGGLAGGDNIRIAGDVLPSAALGFDIGGAALPFHHVKTKYLDIYLSANTQVATFYALGGGLSLSTLAGYDMIIQSGQDFVTLGAFTNINLAAPRIDMSSSGYMDLPSQSATPTAVAGRVYMDSDDSDVYIYSQGGWQKI